MLAKHDIKESVYNLTLAKAPEFFGPITRLGFEITALIEGVPAERFVDIGRQLAAAVEERLILLGYDVAGNEESEKRKAAARVAALMEENESLPSA